MLKLRVKLQLSVNWQLISVKSVRMNWQLNWQLSSQQMLMTSHMEVPDIASVEYVLTLLRGIDALQRARSSNYTGLHMAIEEKERELAETKARLGAEFVEPTNAEAVVEPTDAEAEEFQFKSGMALCKVFF